MSVGRDCFCYFHFSTPQMEHSEMYKFIYRYVFTCLVFYRQFFSLWSAQKCALKVTITKKPQK